MFIPKKPDWLVRSPEPNRAMAETLYLILRSGLFFASCLLAFSQDGAAVQRQPRIQDNSFLIEEAYNQEPGVVQHISTFTRFWNTKDWYYTFTQEWPGSNPRHQFGYTLGRTYSEEFGDAGLADVILNYRYQVAGNGESRVAFAPRVSLLLPTGNAALARGTGGAGVQVNLPLSIVLSPRLVSHWNAGSTFVPSAQGPDHSRAATAGFNVGQSFVFTLHPRFNFLLETLCTRFQSVTGPGATEWSTGVFVSPGIAWAYNFKNGLQIVLGLALPVGVGPSAGEKSALVYLSFEHPFGKSRRD